MSRLCKESISPETVGSILQAIADLLATATSETEYNLEKRDGYLKNIFSVYFQGLVHIE